MGTETIVVTGGAGFIGSALVRCLIRSSDCSVVNVDALTYAANLDSLRDVDENPRYSFEHVDIADDKALRRIFAEYQPSAVFNLAAETHVDRSIDGPAPFIRTNLFGTFQLLEVSLDYWNTLAEPNRSSFRLVHVSTDEVYGDLGGAAPFSETSPFAPNSPYAASKAAADHLVRAWHKTYELPVITTNCSNNYGPFQFPEKLIPRVIIAAIEDKPLPVYGDGSQVRDWLHVEDHVDALLTVMDYGRIGEVYAIGSRNEHRNIDVVAAICQCLDELQPRSDRRSYADQISFVVDRPGHDRRYAVDPSKIESEFEWKAARDWDAGLRETIEWYLGNRSWWEDIRTGAYRGERLGLGR